MNRSATVYIPLALDRFARVEIAIVTQGMPTPHERNPEREPVLTEMEEVTAKLAARKYKTEPPF